MMIEMTTIPSPVLPPYGPPETLPGEFPGTEPDLPEPDDPDVLPGTPDPAPAI